MKKYIIIAALALLALTSCEKQWEDVPTFEPATKEQIIADGYTLMTVNDFKQQYFYSVLPEPGKTVLGITI